MRFWGIQNNQGRGRLLLNGEKMEVMFLSLHWRQATQSARSWHDYPFEIMHRGHTWQDYPWPWVFLTWLLHNLQLDDVTGADFENRPIRREIVSSMYNNICYVLCVVLYVVCIRNVEKQEGKTYYLAWFASSIGTKQSSCFVFPFSDLFLMK